MGVFTRYSINSSEFINGFLTDFKNGVQTLRKRSKNNPADVTGWTNQANIHGTYDAPQQDDWNMCQHQSYFFLPWHRMYIYWFERILRAASGNANLTLPYWDYSDPSQRALPAPFWQPANITNPLYERQRNNTPPGDINQGWQLPPSVVDHSRAFSFLNFTSAVQDNVTGGGVITNSFGGDVVPGTAHFADQNFSGTFDGELEMQPHNNIHDQVGGTYTDDQGEQFTGLMADPNTAARDPIFWLHHSNIDCLWVKWLAQGGSNPTDGNFLNASFNFYDENGTRVTMFVRDILDTSTFKYYIYPDTNQNPQVVAGYTYQ
jgi:tyrosinase